MVDKDGDRMGGRRNTTGTTFRSPGKDGQDPQSTAPSRRGRGPAGSGEVAIDERAAHDAGFKVGDRIRVVANGPVLTPLLVGVLLTTDDAQCAKLGGTLTLFDRLAPRRPRSGPARRLQHDRRLRRPRYRRGRAARRDPTAHPARCGGQDRRRTARRPAERHRAQRQEPHPDAADDSPGMRVRCSSGTFIIAQHVLHAGRPAHSA
ncbi:hypothetical protein ACU686_05850 [Yinghuangia aomiensis]